MPLFDSLEMHLNQFKAQQGQMTIEGELKDNLMLVFHADTLQNKLAAWRNFCEAWQALEEKYGQDYAWSSFIYKIYTLLETYLQNTNPSQETLWILSESQKFVLTSLEIKPQYLPPLIQARLKKISDWLRTQPFSSAGTSIAQYQLAIVGSFPRKVIEYQMLYAKHCMDPTNVTFILDLKKFETQLLKTDIDVRFYIEPTQADMKDIYKKLVRPLENSIQMRLGSTSEPKVYVNTPGAEFITIKTTDENIDISVLASGLKTQCIGNSYWSITFTDQFEAKKLIQPQWPYFLNPNIVIHSFFHKQTLTPALWQIRDLLMLHGCIPSGKISLIAHCFKNIEKLLKDGWILGPWDQIAINRILSYADAVIMPNSMQLNLTVFLSTYIAQRYHNKNNAGDWWLTNFLALPSLQQKKRSNIQLTLRPKKQENQQVPQEALQEQITIALENKENTDVEIPMATADINSAITHDEHSDDEKSKDPEPAISNTPIEKEKNIKKRKRKKKKEKEKENISYASANEDSDSNLENEAVHIAPMPQAVEPPVVNPNSDTNTDDTDTASQTWIPQDEKYYEQLARLLVQYGYHPKGSVAAMAGLLFSILSGFRLPYLTTITLFIYSLTFINYWARTHYLPVFQKNYLKKINDALRKLDSKINALNINDDETLPVGTRELIRNHIEDILIYAEFACYYNKITGGSTVEFTYNNKRFRSLELIHQKIQEDFGDSFEKACYFIKFFAQYIQDKILILEPAKIHSLLNKVFENNGKVFEYLYFRAILASKENTPLKTSKEYTLWFKAADHVYSIPEGSSIDSELDKNDPRVKIVSQALAKFPNNKNARFHYYNSCAKKLANENNYNSWFSRKNDADIQGFNSLFSVFIEKFNEDREGSPKFLYASFSEMFNQGIHSNFLNCFIDVCTQGALYCAHNKNADENNAWKNIFYVNGVLLGTLHFEGLRFFIEQTAKNLSYDPDLIAAYFHSLNNQDNRANFFNDLTASLSCFLLWHPNLNKARAALKQLALRIRMSFNPVMLADFNDILYQQAVMLLITMETFKVELSEGVFCFQLEERDPKSTYSFSALHGLIKQIYRIPSMTITEKNKILKQMIYDKSTIIDTHRSLQLPELSIHFNKLSI